MNVNNNTPKVGPSFGISIEMSPEKVRKSFSKPLGQFVSVRLDEKTRNTLRKQNRKQFFSPHYERLLALFNRGKV